MNREIEFRGLYNNKWFYGYLERHNDVNGSELFINENQTLYEINPKTIGQYTGLKDKNGKKIFEGDIVKDGIVYGTIVYCNEHGAFGVNDIDDGFQLYSEYFSKCEVIGNIFDKEDNNE